MVLGAVVGCAAVAAGALVITANVAHDLRQNLHVSQIRGAVTNWNAALARQTADLRHLVEQQVDADGGGHADLVALQTSMTGRGIAAIQILRPDGPMPPPAAGPGGSNPGSLLDSAVVAEPPPTAGPSGSNPGSLLDSAVVAEALWHRRALSGLIRRGDEILVAVALPVPLGSQTPQALLVAAHGVTGLIDAMHDETGAAFGLADASGRFLVAPPGPREWVTLLEQTAPRAGMHRSLGLGDRVLGVDDLPLLDLAGRNIGFRRLVSDNTDQQWTDGLERLKEVALLLGLLTAVSAALATWARGTFHGLESALVALQSLARGDMTVRIDNENGPDEAGAAARALRIFRQGQIALRSNTSRALRRGRQRLRYIEAQLDKLSGTLDAGERGAMDSEIRRSAGSSEIGESDALDTLAVAFRIMVERVLDQHTNLQRLVADKDAALLTQARVTALEQEVSLVGRMQARLAPEALPDEGLVSVRGRLLQGEQFGGDFIDFFWLDDGVPHRRLALVLGWVDGPGLTAAFLAISARALVRALAASAASPGACLARVSDLLVADNESGLGLNMTLVSIDTETNLMVAARAGLPPPVAAVRAGAARVLNVEGAPPLGLRLGTRVPDTTLDLPARTALVLFSQGVAGTRIKGSPLGAEGMRDLLARAPDLDPDPLVTWLAGQITGPDAVRSGDASLVVLRSRA
jgi:sigma-B regulation protein RsbU (phosphoserine phosphatase)